jgi:hypothetical protein
MTRILLAAVATSALVFGATSLGFAQSQTPGHQMQKKGSMKGEPGASGYAPGHKMQARGSKRGSPGASGYAPGHNKNTGTRKRR